MPGYRGFSMTAPYLVVEEARDEKASDDMRVPGDHGIDDGVWEFADGFAGLRRSGPERLLPVAVA